MTEKNFKRKLTAILSADVEGYSRLMGKGVKGSLTYYYSNQMDSFGKEVKCFTVK